MSDFRRLSDTMLASPQITSGDIAEAKRAGVKLIINNRPEGESPDQTPGPAIQSAAETAGIGYTAIPIDHGGFREQQVEAMVNALESAGGPVLGYCRSGTRSTFLWALAQARMGSDPEELTAAAARAGYDIAPIRRAVEALATR